VLVLERNERDTLIGGVALGEVDRPVPRLPKLIVVGCPPVTNAGTAIRDEARQIGMVGEVFAVRAYLPR
jgi:hypothetical protein